MFNILQYAEIKASIVYGKDDFYLGFNKTKFNK